MGIKAFPLFRHKLVLSLLPAPGPSEILQWCQVTREEGQRLAEIDERLLSIKEERRREADMKVRKLIGLGSVVFDDCNVTLITPHSHICHSHTWTVC